MPKRLQDFHKDSPRYSYDWDKYLDGSTWQFTFDELAPNHQSNPNNFRLLVYQRSRYRGTPYSCHIDSSARTITIFPKKP